MVLLLLLHLDSYRDAGLIVALSLIKKLAPAAAERRGQNAMSALHRILEFDPRSAPKRSRA
jgi:hypothetical protein